MPLESGVLTLISRTTAEGLRVETSIPRVSLTENSSIDTLSPELEARIDQSTTDLSRFLKTHYSRRAWSEEFTAKASDLAMLKKRVTRSVRTLIYNKDGILVATGTLILSPYVAIRAEGTAQKKIIPWMSMENLEKAEKNGFKDLSFKEWLLPVEKFFDVQFDRKATSSEVPFNINGKTYLLAQGFLAEMGSYAIDIRSPLREKAAEELYYDFLMSSYESLFTVNARERASSVVSQMSQAAFANQAFFFSYGENIGQRLYRPYGLAPIKALERHEYGVDWMPLATGRSLHSTYVSSKRADQVAQRVFDALLLQGREIHSGKSWLGFSMSQDISSVIKERQFEYDFFSVTEPNLREKYLEYTKMDDTP